MLVRELIEILKGMDQDMTVLTPSQYARDKYRSMDGWVPWFVTVVQIDSPLAAYPKYIGYDEQRHDSRDAIEAVVIS